MEIRDSLTDEQKEAFDIMCSGENVFLTGNAGTGKSYVTKAFIAWCEQQHKEILITAPTGVAAINIGGSTLHRIFNAPVDPIINNYTPSTDDVIDRADIILIDEISMCRMDLFNYVVTMIRNSILKTHKNKQIILVGDFFQLPPVVTPIDRKILNSVYPKEITKFYAFQSKEWDTLNLKSVVLTKVVRQTDPAFIAQLNKARIGDWTCIKYFNKNIGNLNSNAIYLCGRNDDAYNENNKCLNQIHALEHENIAELKGAFKKSDCTAEEVFRYKVGARVMSLINDNKNENYQNGSLGTITGIKSTYNIIKRVDQDIITVKFDNGHIADIEPFTWEKYDYTVKDGVDEKGNPIKHLDKESIGECIQYPLKLAYAITIHKSQGQTFDNINLIPQSFSVGQLYVALSRVRSFEGLRLVYNISSNDLKCDSDVVNFYAKITNPEKLEEQYDLNNLCEVIATWPNNIINMFIYKLKERVTADRK